MKQGQAGFTLVEVVITVVIMGIALLPLSSIFTLSLDRTSKAEELLVVNQLAQQYIEVVKAESNMNLEREAVLQITSSGILGDSDALSGELPTIKSGYYAEIKIRPEDVEGSSTEGEEAELITESASHMEVDFSEAYIQGFVEPFQVDITYSQGSVEGSTLIDYKLKDKNSNLVESRIFEEENIKKNAILKLTSDVQVEVNVFNKVPEVIIVEVHTNTGKIKINLKDGMIIKRYNPRPSIEQSHMLYLVSVAIYKNGDLQPLTTLETTKIS